MSKLTIGVFSLLGLISACVGQGIIQTGQCDPNVATLTNFVASQYTGTWYDIESLPSTFQSGTCNTAQYTAIATGISIVNSQVDSEGYLQTASGTATLQTGVPAGTAKFDVIISGNTAVPYWVLDTDYTTFALVYSCRNVNAVTRQVNSWKLGRSTGPLPAEATARINAIVAAVPALAAASTSYVQRNHTLEGCYRFVELEGPCPTVAGAANFDASIFQGTWYESSRYRQQFQTGQCNRAQYAVGANGIVNVQNSQVIGQALFTRSGVAFEVTGRPGVLQVNFNVNDELRSQNLVVLATDNTNYALLYSCLNIEGNKRRISSWQLRKQLAPISDAHGLIINNTITGNTELELNQYLPTSQSDSSCFHYPEWDPLPATIDLPGPCDPTITGAANFNAATFVGPWYEVARFPQPTQTGQCNRALYQSTGGGITVQNSQVTAETLSTIQGTAATVAGLNGVLDVTLNTGSGPVTRRLIVIATDNTNYALLYSCQNIEGNQRRVGSWKMSKQLGPLSDAATTAINAAVNATEGLKESYYVPTSQTDAACFYYPVWTTPPATIELPGPCNTSITGVVGFNAERFLGTWYEVARYPQPTQTGQCNRAVYGPVGTGGVITVQNSQVNAEVLNTIPGTATAVTGQSGVLDVTLNPSSGPVTQRLYVLDTDYDNYALLYSCQNIEGNSRRVGSWQLTRSLGPLNAESNVAISAKIEATQGLRQSYYQSTSQSDLSCFYYPVWDTLPTTIDLPGPCNTSITGTTAFNAQTFLGTWHEVERYPQPTQAGQCNRAVYSAGTGGVINVQNSQVTAQTLSTILGTATAVAGQTGVLDVILNPSSGPVTQRLIVIATDNTNYALLYSCQNIVGNQRRVGSWKMIKQSGTLSEAANATINTAIANTQGLSQNYYQPTSQAAGVCFHYPATQAGEKVIIPGQCEATVTGHQNINTTRFATGNWYHISRYDQVGNRTCIGTRLSYEASDAGNYVRVNSVELVGNVENRTEGRAQLISAPNSQFNLTWSGSQVSTIFNIMATDYDGYAIAYTCENSGTDNRQVGVWLLSRGRTWPAAGVTALATLVQNRDEFTLRDGYFKAIPHNDDCPEPSSAFLFKSSIIVIFVCTILQFVW